MSNLPFMKKSRRLWPWRRLNNFAMFLSCVALQLVSVRVTFAFQGLWFYRLLQTPVASAKISPIGASPWGLVKKPETCFWFVGITGVSIGLSDFGKIDQSERLLFVQIFIAFNPPKFAIAVWSEKREARSEKRELQIEVSKITSMKPYFFTIRLLRSDKILMESHKKVKMCLDSFHASHRLGLMCTQPSSLWAARNGTEGHLSFGVC